MRYVLLTPPTEHVVSLVDAKAHLRVDHDEDDALISALIAAAERHLDGRDGILGGALVTQTWRLDTTAPDCGAIRIELPPVSSISSVTYLSSGVETTWPADQYRLEYDGPNAIVRSVWGWPAADKQGDAWRVTFTAGTAVADVPAPLKIAVLLLVALWYANREPVTEGAMSEMPFAVTALVAPYRTMRV